MQQYLTLKRALQGLSHYSDVGTYLTVLNETQARVGPLLAGPAAIVGAPVPGVTLGPSSAGIQVGSDLPFLQQPQQVLRQQIQPVPTLGNQSFSLSSMSGVAPEMTSFPLVTPSVSPDGVLSVASNIPSGLIGDSEQLLNFSDPVSFLSTVANATTSLFAEQDESLRLFDGGMYGP
jgi:hypothetical protein